MQVTIRRLAAAALCLAVLAGPAAGQARKAIAGTSVSLNAPAGFESAAGFAGLQNKATNASIVIVEMPAEAYAQLATLFGDLATAKTNFARQNVVVEARQELDTASGKVPVLSGSQKAGAATFDKWIALFKGDRTVLVTVQAPHGSGLGEEAVRGMFRSVSLGAEPSLADKLAALPFTVTVAEPFRVVDTIGGSGALITAGPLNADPAGKQPLIIVAYQLSSPTGIRIEELATSLLKQTRSLENATVTDREARSFAGSTGYLLSGTNEQGKRFEQHLGIGPNGRFVRLIAIADAEAFARLQPTIAKIAASIAFRPAK